MCSDRRDTSKELEAILEGLLDSIEAAPAEDFAEDARAEGRDLKLVAEEVKGSLLAGVKRFEQRKLQTAREVNKERARLGAKQAGKYKPPDAPEDCRNQFFAFLNAKPEIKAKVTAQYRDFEEMTDEDIRSALEDFAELGLFDDWMDDKSE